MNLMKLNVGDWSKDGHNISEQVLLLCNKEVFQIQEAYKNSCKLVGLQFNNNEDYTELTRDIQGYDKYKKLQSLILLNEYTNNYLNNYQIDLLSKYKGFSELFNEIVYFEDYYYHSEEDDKLYIDNSRNFTKLFMWFVGLSLDSLVWEFYEKEDNIPNINGYWDKNLNVTIGYGIFDN